METGTWNPMWPTQPSRHTHHRAQVGPNLAWLVGGTVGRPPPCIAGQPELVPWSKQTWPAGATLPALKPRCARGCGALEALEEQEQQGLHPEPVRVFSRWPLGLHSHPRPGASVTRWRPRGAGALWAVLPNGGADTTAGAQCSRCSAKLFPHITCAAPDQHGETAIPCYRKGCKDSETFRHWPKVVPLGCGKARV